VKNLKRHFIVVFLSLAGMVLLSQCTDDSFVPDVDLEGAGTMSILSGNDQYSFHGTELPNALVVEVESEESQAARGVAIRFVVTQGGGSLSEETGVTDENGRASTRLTLGGVPGPNQVRAFVASDAAISVVFDATSANFFCPEAEDNLQVCKNCPTSYLPDPNQLDLFLVTARSGLYPNGSPGVVQVAVTSPPAAAGFVEMPPLFGTINYVTWDGAFSARGEYFVTRRAVFPEIVRIDVDKTVSQFATLDPGSAVDYRAEITTNPFGLLAGCDNRGPFVVACRDSIIRFAEATYADGINNDAVAVDQRRQSEDPLGEDIYFIDTTDQTLYRLPLANRLVEAQGLQPVAVLTTEQATGACGMVCNDTNGDVYILVDTDATKELLEVTPGGIVTQLYDFFSRGGGTAQEAGKQSDLAIRRPNLFTLDTLNDKLLVYNLAGTLTELFADSLEQAKLSERDSSGNLDGGERVGLDVIR